MSITQEQLTRLRGILDESQRIVFFGGAGVSTESGIPDFRSEDSREKTMSAFGLYPETILSADFFWQDPQTFYRYVADFIYHPEARPNAAHRALAELEQEGKLEAVVTQNIDGLHQKAGSTKVWELHGTLQTFTCQSCASQADVENALAGEAGPNGVPLCECGGTFKPDVVLYQEALPENALVEAASAIELADTLIVAGTSLAVYPAAGLVPLFHGRNLVVINLSETPADARADLVIRAPVGEVLREAIA